MKFKKVEGLNDIKKEGIVYLIYQHWDDYQYCTTFTAYCKKENIKHRIGTVKIGCRSLSKKVEEGMSSNGFPSYSIEKLIPKSIFNKLSDNFFSLGQDVEFYKNINRYFEDEAEYYYNCLKDLAYDIERFKVLYANHEPSLINSLMRSLYPSVVEQFHRITKGGSELTKYEFSFKYEEESININVIPESLPPSNIHVLIGRNGVGKTWLLYNIVHRFLEEYGIDKNCIEKSDKYKISNKFKIENMENCFAGIIGISFSVFDDALSINLKEAEKKNQMTVDNFKKVYRYIGLQCTSEEDGKIRIKSVKDLQEEFMEVLGRIKESPNKVKTYLETCKHLNNDPMFNDNGFIELLKKYLEEIGDLEGREEKVQKDFSRLSSGHMIIILSLTMLVESIHEKTIVIIDEPETHLHPPLLSTYIRTLSYLLLRKNAVALIATHSPIILQEVPRNCVTKVIRTVKDMRFESVALETFASNIDSLTREVFGLEVIKTGFYKLIESKLEDNFAKTLDKFDGNIGPLGQIMIQSLLNQMRGEDEEN